MSLVKGVPYVNYFKVRRRGNGCLWRSGTLMQLISKQTEGSLMSLVKGVPYVNYFKDRRNGHLCLWRRVSLM